MIVRRIVMLTAMCRAILLCLVIRVLLSIEKMRLKDISIGKCKRLEKYYAKKIKINGISN